MTLAQFKDQIKREIMSRQDFQGVLYSENVATRFINEQEDIINDIYLNPKLSMFPKELVDSIFTINSEE